MNSKTSTFLATLVLAAMLSASANSGQAHGLEHEALNSTPTQMRTTQAVNPSHNIADGDSYSDAMRLYQEGRYVEAARAYKTACDSGSAQACTDLGVMYRRGQGIRKNYPRAAELSLRGCHGGNALGCTNLGLMYWSNVLPKNDKRSVELFERGCDGGDKNGCRALAFMYENGQGVPRDVSRAAVLYQKANEQAREHRIPFTVQDGLILIETKINDEIVKLIVDTGATTALAIRFLHPRKRSDLPTQTLDLARGSMQVYPIRVTWSLDGENKQVAALAGEFHLPNGADGIVGADMLETFQSARFDFTNSVLILEDQ